MGFFGLLNKTAPVRKPQSRGFRFRPRLEGLETRVVPYNASGNLWPSSQLVTISFMPDGTNLGGVNSNLFSTFNAKFGSASTWENVILKAAQQWAQQTNLNFAVVPDSGAPAGSGNYQQGDATMGDIRIGGYNFGTSTLAAAYLPPSVNNYSIAGDISFNTGQVFNIGTTYDLSTVALHEFGHALGLLGSSTISAAMYETYSGVKSGLVADDVSGIQSIYGGARRADVYGAANNSFSNAADLTSQISASLTEQSNPLDIATAGQKEYFKITAPAGTGSTVQVSAQSQGLSLLAPTLTVYAADQVTVLGSASGYGQYGTTLTVTLTNRVSAGQTIYVKVGGADNTAVGTGNYALSLRFGSAGLPAVVPPNTQLLNGSPLSGGGGQANAESPEYAVSQPGLSLATQPESPQAVGMDAAGNYVVVFSAYNSKTGGWAVNAQLYDRNSNPRTGVFQVNTTSNGYQEYATVAMDAAGNFMVTWSSWGQDGDGWGVFAQRYDPQGNPLGKEFQVNTSVVGDQLYSSVAANPAGGFLVTWSSFARDGSGLGILGQLYDAQGNPLGGEFQINSTPGYDAYSTVAANANGYVVTWSNLGHDGSGWGIFARRYDAQGNPLGGEFQVNTWTLGDQEYSSVAMNDTGAFTITWSSHELLGWQIEAQRFDPAGNPLGNEFQVNQVTTGDHMYPTIASTAEGGFLITWSSNTTIQDPIATPVLQGQNTLNGWNLTATSANALSLIQPKWNVYAQQYSGDDGSPMGEEFQVNTTMTGDHRYSSIVSDNTGRFVVAWSGQEVDGTSGVFIERFAMGEDNLESGDTGAAASGIDGAPAATSGSARGVAPATALGNAAARPSVVPTAPLASAAVDAGNLCHAPVGLCTGTVAQSIPPVSLGLPAAALEETPGRVTRPQADHREAPRGADSRAEEAGEASTPNSEPLRTPLAPPSDERIETLPAVQASEREEPLASDACFAEGAWMVIDPASTDGSLALASDGDSPVTLEGGAALALAAVLASYHVKEQTEEAKKVMRKPSLA